MKSMRGFLRLITTLALLALLVLDMPRAHATSPGTITVNTTSNTLSDGLCSLPEAINLVDGVAGADVCARVGSPSIDTIQFSIGSGVQTITLASELDIISPVLIDGSTQSGYVAGSPGQPKIHVTSSSSAELFRFQTGSAGSTLKALQVTNTTSGPDSVAISLEADNITVISSYLNTDGVNYVMGDSSIGVEMSPSSDSTLGGSTPSKRNLIDGGLGIRLDEGSNNLIQGNYFGVQAGGSAALGSPPSSAPTGIEVCFFAVATGCTGNVIRNNNIAGGLSTGVVLGRYTYGDTIAGNYIGIGADGVTRLGNGIGIALVGSDVNTIGGTTPADRNVIAGNVSGIRLTELSGSTPDKNVIKGNYFGTTADGMSSTTTYGDFTGDLYGVEMYSGDENQIGGTSAGSGNLISGNNLAGILVSTATTGTVILGNKIGTNATATAALHQQIGIDLETGVNADVGDSGTPGNNLIAGNQAGIFLHGSTGSTIYGNLIGPSVSGFSPIPNTYGIELLSASSATIAQNWIGYNPNRGVLVDGTSTTDPLSRNNCITHNGTYGVEGFNVGTPASFTDNWWGDASGPGGVGPGSGDAVTDHVDYTGFLTSRPAACPWYVTVGVHGSNVGNYVVPSHTGLRDGYAGINSGPAEATNNNDGSVVSSIRVLFGGSSYSEMMGFPNNTTTDFWFPWYNNTAFDSQFRVSNLGGSSTTITVSLGGSTIDSFSLGAGAAIRKNYAGQNSGPMHVSSSGGVPILSTIRVLFGGTSYSEMMGFPNNTTTDFWFPWYNNVAMDSQFRVSNLGSTSTTITVSLAGGTIDSFTLPAGAAIRKNYAGQNNGPMHVSSSATPVLATIRVLYGGSSYSEMMGFQNNTTTDFWFPWYDNVGADSQFRVSNLGGSPTTITVSLAGTPIDSFSLGAGAAIRKNYPAQNGGAFHITSSGQAILATVRVLYAGTSFYEVMGYPGNALTSTQYFPWYNNTAFNSQMRIAVP